MAQQPRLELEYVDLPSVPDVFADIVEKCIFDGATRTLRIELCVSRIHEFPSPHKATGSKSPVYRLVLPVPTVVELGNRFAQIMIAFEKEGLLKKRIVAESPAGGKPS